MEKLKSPVDPVIRRVALVGPRCSSCASGLHECLSSWVDNTTLLHRTPPLIGPKLSEASQQPKTPSSEAGFDRRVAEDASTRRLNQAIQTVGSRITPLDLTHMDAPLVCM